MRVLWLVDWILPLGTRVPIVRQPVSLTAARHALKVFAPLATSGTLELRRA